MDIMKDLNELDIDLNLPLEDKKLDGTRRQYIRYENDDYVFTLNKMFKPKIKCFGISNRTEDNKHILFLDYDRIYKKVMLKDLRNLIGKFPRQFDNFYIARTEPEAQVKTGETIGSYHVINLVKHSKADINKFVSRCNVDPYFIELPEKTAHKCHVLRFSEKEWEENGKTVKERPQFLQAYPEETLFSGQECSLAHYKLFKDKWGIDTISLLHKFDNLTMLELHKYSTPKGEPNGKK